MIGAYWRDSQETGIKMSTSQLPAWDGGPMRECLSPIDVEMREESEHERLVAYVHAVAGDQEERCGVWVEHSYARARGGGGRGGGSLRTFLAPRVSAPPPDLLDVLAIEPRPPPPATLRADPCAAPRPSPIELDEPDDWQERLEQLAPSAAHARLLHAALRVLDALRLARLASEGLASAALQRDEARAAAARLRAALAPAWLAYTPPHPRPPAWLHAALRAHLPSPLAALYRELVTELRRAAPRLADRMLAGTGWDPTPLGPDASLPALSLREGGGPLVVWVSCCGEPAEAQWEAGLRARAGARVVRAAGGGGGMEPVAWCARAADAARRALDDVAAEAGARGVALVGLGAGAALAASLARAGMGGGVRALVLLAPPLLTAEGPRDALDDPLYETEVPMLVVMGSRAADCSRGAACVAATGGGAARGAGRGAARRVLVLEGADERLRVPLRVARAARLPALALHAALLEEVVRFVQQAEEPAPAPASPPAPAPPQGDQRGTHVEPDDKYSHLPPTPALELGAASEPSAALDSPAQSAPLASANGSRVSVTRGSGAVPLALPPPRRASPAPPALAPADILRLPIVFADDEPEPPAPPAAPGPEVTVRSGAGGGGGRYTRVIVAKRGRGTAPLLVRCLAPPASRQ